jgi:hypothetical protein
MGEPVIKSSIAPYLNLFPPSFQDWFFLSIIVIVPIWWVRRRLRPSAAKADAIYALIETTASAIKRARLTNYEQTMVWRSFIVVLVDSIASNSVPATQTIIEAIEQEQSKMKGRL